MHRVKAYIDSILIDELIVWCMFCTEFKNVGYLNLKIVYLTSS